MPQLHAKSVVSASGLASASCTAASITRMPAWSPPTKVLKAQAVSARTRSVGEHSSASRRACSSKGVARAGPPLGQEMNAWSRSAPTAADLWDGRALTTAERKESPASRTEPRMNNARPSMR